MAAPGAMPPVDDWFKGTEASAQPKTPAPRESLDDWFSGTEVQTQKPPSLVGKIGGGIKKAFTRRDPGKDEGFGNEYAPFHVDLKTDLTSAPVAKNEGFEASEYKPQPTVAAPDLSDPRQRGEYVRDQARKRFGSRLSDAHYDLMGTYSSLTGASVRTVFNMASKGQFDEMRKAVMGKVMPGFFGTPSAAKPPVVTPITPEMIRQSDEIARAQRAANTGTDQAWYAAYQARQQAEATDKFKKRYGVEPTSPKGIAIQTNEDTARMVDNLKSMGLGWVSGILMKVADAVNPTGAIVRRGIEQKTGIGIKDEDVLPGLIAGTANLPADILSDAAIAVHPQSSIGERAGAAANIVLKTLGPEEVLLKGTGVLAKGKLIWDDARLTKSLVDKGLSHEEAVRVVKATNEIIDQTAARKPFVDQLLMKARKVVDYKGKAELADIAAERIKAKAPAAKEPSYDFPGEGHAIRPAPPGTPALEGPRFGEHPADAYFDGLEPKGPPGGAGGPKTGISEGSGSPGLSAFEKASKAIEEAIRQNDKIVPFADIAEHHGVDLDALRGSFYNNPDTGRWEKRVQPSGQALQPATSGQPYYHGHRSDIGSIQSLSEGAFSNNLFGEGLYLTDKPEVASRYAKQGMTRGYLANGTKLASLDEPTPEAILKKWETAFGYEPGDLSRTAPMGQVWKDLEYDHHEFGAQGPRERLTDGVLAAGYDGLTHKGNDRAGWRQGGNGATNNVVILYKADKLGPSRPDLSLREADASLLKLDPNDPRLDPFTDEFDPDLAHVIQQRFGRPGDAESLGPAMILERAQAEAVGKEMEFQAKLAESHAELGSHFDREMLKSERSTRGYVRWYRRKGKWVPDPRPSQRITGTPANEFPEHVRSLIESYVENDYRDPEYVVLAPEDHRNATGMNGQYSYGGWITAPSKAMRLSEWALQDRGGKAQIFPAPVLRSFVRDRGVQLSPPKLQKAAEALGLSNDELQAAIEYHRATEPERIGDRSAAPGGGPDAEPRATSDGDSGSGTSGALFDVAPELELTPEAIQAGKKPKPDGTNPVGPQLSLSPEELGDKSGQLGLSGMSEARVSGASSRQTPPAQTPSGSPQPATPATPPIAPATGGFVDAFKQLFKPESRSQGSKITALLSREHGAALARRRQVAIEQLENTAKFFEGQSQAENYDFIAKMEAGAKQPTPELQAMADTIRQMLDERREEVRSLGTGKLENFIENYFPHIWKDPNRASAVFGRILGRRPLQGTKSFLKKRSIDTFEEGIANGLEPVSDNPVTLTLLKVHEMDRYIMAQRLAAELKERGLLKYVRSGARIPEGFAEIKDPMFIVHGPRTVPIFESFDPDVMQGLEDFAESIGVNLSRVVKIKGKPNTLGGQAGDNVITKFGSPEQVLTHEIGHYLDEKFGLGEYLRKHGGDAWETESADLADLRIPEDGGAPGFAGYVQHPDERVANLVHAVIHAPELAQEVAPLSTGLFQDFVAEHPELEPLMEIKPSLRLGQREGEMPVPGRRIMGQYYAPADVAHIVNTYLSPGLRFHPSPAVRGMFNAYVGLNNLMNQANLSFSAFHGVTTSLNSSISDVGLGLEKLSQAGSAQGGGVLNRFANVAKGAQNILSGIFPFYSVTRDVITGQKLRKAFLSAEALPPEIAPIVEGIVKAGGRVSLDNFYTTNSLGRFLDSWRKTVGGLKGKRLGDAARGGLGMSREVVPALIELSSKPIMGGLVPRVKLGAFMRLYASELERLGPNATEDELRQAAASVWDSIDNRFGQLVYDNIFWQKAVKEVGMASMRSMGWNLGTLREIGGAAPEALADVFTGKGFKSGVGHKTAYTIAMPIVVGLYGAALMYLLTGKRPETTEDYFFPKTGRKNPDGTDERLTLPSYMKDIYGFSHSPRSTIIHKAAPAISALGSMMENKDFWGEEIRNADDPLVQQFADSLTYMLKQMQPFTVSSFEKFQEDDGGADATKVLAFAGVQPAPVYISRSEALERAKQYVAEMAPQGTRTHDEVVASQVKRRVMGYLRNGEEVKAQKLMDSSGLSKKAQRDLYEEASMSGLQWAVKRLDAAKAIRVFEVATPEERKEIAADIARKIYNAVKNGKLGWTEKRADDLFKQYPELGR